LTERQQTTDRLNDWVRFYQISVEGYQLNALLAVLNNDGPQMLQLVLKKLGLVSSLALIQDMKKRGS
jgi:hypothetical protein